MIMSIITNVSRISKSVNHLCNMVTFPPLSSTTITKNLPKKLCITYAFCRRDYSCCRTQTDSGLYSSGSFTKMMIYGLLYGEEVKKEVM